MNHKGNKLVIKIIKNLINLSRINLSQSEISLLPEGLKFVPSPNKIVREN